MHLDNFLRLKWVFRIDIPLKKWQHEKPHCHSKSGIKFFLYFMYLATADLSMAASSTRSTISPLRMMNVVGMPVTL